MKNKFFTYFIIILLSSVVSACNTTPDGDISLQPYSLDLTPPDGPPEYQKGWSDGCESGANAYANNFYKYIEAFDYKYDANLHNNKMYFQVWWDAFIYCSIYWERTNEPNI